MKNFYFLLFFFATEISTATSERTTSTKFQLKRKKKHLQKDIKYLQDRILYEEANAEEPAKLYGSLKELELVNQKIKKLSHK